MLYNIIISAIRTGIAGLVGLAVTWLIARGIEIDSGTQATLIVLLFGAIVAAYNAMVNWLAIKVSPSFGYLLGAPKTPEYNSVAAVQKDGQIVATTASTLETGELVYVAPVEPHDPSKVDNAEPAPYPYGD